MDIYTLVILAILSPTAKEKGVDVVQMYSVPWSLIIKGQIAVLGCPEFQKIQDLSSTICIKYHITTHVTAETFWHRQFLGAAHQSTRT